MPSLPPGPKKWFPGQHLLLLRRNVLDTLQWLAREYGDVTCLRIGPHPLVLVSHPDLIRTILITDARQYAKGRGLDRTKRLIGTGLLTSEGDFHLRQRRLAQPAFHRDRIVAYADVMRERAARSCGSWDDGDELDVSQIMMKLTLEVAGATLFGADLASETEEIGAALTESFELFRFATLPYTEVLDHLSFLPINKRFDAARVRLDRTIYRIIAERRASEHDRGDLLSMLLLARDTEGNTGSMSDLQLRDEALTILLAAHETTANALSWTFYLLSQHPDIERELHAELDRVLGDRAVTAADVPRLTYTRAVLAESMRLYPPAWTLGRKPLADVVIGGYRVPRNSLVLMSQWVVHRDPRWWPEAERFYPDRWRDDEQESGNGARSAVGAAQASRPRLAYFPFGAGTRVCIGESFAWMEGIIILATIAQRWRLERVRGHPVIPFPLVTLRPRQGIRMRVRRRE